MPQAQPELKKVRQHNRSGQRIYNANFPLVEYLDKRLFVQLNGSRKVIGVLRGYDVRSTTLAILIGVLYAVHGIYGQWDQSTEALGPQKRISADFGFGLQVFLNIVLDDAVEEKAGGEKVRIGMVVS